MAKLSQTFAFPLLAKAARLWVATAVLAGSMLARADESTLDKGVVPSSPMPMPESEAAMTPAIAARRDALWQDRPLAGLKAAIKPTQGELPPNAASPRLAQAGMQYFDLGDSRPWLFGNSEWDAPATRHLPLLFEQPNVERLGYTYGFYHQNDDGCETSPHLAECLQPLVSGVHFYGSLALMPLILAVDDPCTPFYTLGTDRPGSPSAYRKHLMPLDHHRGWHYEAFDDEVLGSNLRRRTQAHSLAMQRLLLGEH